MTGQYYNDPNLTTLVLTRVDPTVNFNWGTGSPDPSVNVDAFSVRWSGQVEPLYSETYTFYTTTDDGVRLWVNGQQLINKWTTQAATVHSGTITLVAGQKYSITMEYFENTVNARAKLEWSSASQPRQVIPSTQLYP